MRPKRFRTDRASRGSGAAITSCVNGPHESGAVVARAAPAIPRSRPNRRLAPNRRRTILIPYALLQLCDLLAQHRRERAEAAAIAFDPRGKAVAQRDLHADAVDPEIGDAVARRKRRDMPVELQPAAVAAHQLAAHDDV